MSDGKLMEMIKQTIEQMLAEMDEEEKRRIDELVEAAREDRLERREGSPLADYECPPEVES
jgi:siroheme synthase (precorrin-2 oxidase/ferrochelatase)